MSLSDRMRTIQSVQPRGRAQLQLSWSDGVQAELDLSGWFSQPAFAALRDPAEFALVEVGDWGQSLTWPSGVEAGADRLWLETLSARQRDDTRTFLEWRLRNGLSLGKAAEAIGLSRRMVAYYSNGEQRVPRTVLLACQGWEAGLSRIKSRRSALPVAALKNDVRFLSSAYSEATGRSSRGANSVANKDQLYVERREQGDYAVRRANSERASAVLPTQAEAIQRAKELNPNGRPVVERVRNTDVGGRDKWRKA